MEIRKGPFGHFICERINSNTSIFEHSIEMINSGIPGNYLPTYIYEYPGIKELSYDFSGYKRLNEIKDISINTRRKAIGDLFLSFHRSLDLLLPLSNVLIDINYIFANDQCEKLYVCYRPILEDTSMQIEKLISTRIESLLNNEFFKDALNNDEINHLIFSIKNNDEELYVSTCKLIQNSKLSKEKEKKSNNYLILIISLIVAAISYFFVGLIPALCLILVSVIYFSIQYYFKPNIKTEDSSETNASLQETRKQILFNDNEKSNQNSFNAMFIESLEKIDGEYINNAIYTARATIGSDYFLSDICINDKSVAALNAEILFNNGIYTIRNVSNMNNILVEGITLIPDKEYELKTGQTISIGRINLKIRIGF